MIDGVSGYVFSFPIQRGSALEVATYVLVRRSRFWNPKSHGIDRAKDIRAKDARAFGHRIDKLCRNESRSLLK